MRTSALVPLRFGAFEFDPISGNLRRRGLKVKLQPHATELLRLLLSSPLRIHSREEIQRRLWHDKAYLDFEHGLNKVVHSVREALGDTGTNSRFIETVAGRGYRFVPEWLQSRAAMPTKITTGGQGYSLAVFACQHSRGQSGTHFWSGRITAALTKGLTEIQGLRVLAHGSVKNLIQQDASPQGFGAALGVRAVISGELILHENKFVLQEELIDVSDGAQVSAAEVEGTFGPGQISEKELANEILAQLRPKLLSLGSG